MTWLLHIETSGKNCSVALSNGDGQVLLKESDDGLRHSELITIFIQQLLEQANINTKSLSAISVSTGPGSYTGLRVGFSSAKGLCYVLQIPIIGVSTLQSLAHAAIREFPLSSDQEIISGLIARRNEVYFASFDHNLQVLMPLQNIHAEGFASHITSRTKSVVGNFFDEIDIEIPAHLHRFSMQPSAQHLVSLAHMKYDRAEFDSVAYVEPNYFKMPNITQSKRVSLRKS